MLAYRDAGSVDPALYEGMTTEEVRAVFLDFARLAGGDRLRLYMGTLAMAGEDACDDRLVEAYVESRLATVALLRALRDSFARPPGGDG